MIRRFCLYGFLKNQRYFEPFWILAFLDQGLSFTLIGVLIGFREVCVALLEIPTGTLADVVGRRWAMILSHIAYVVAFVTFGVASSVAALFLAMFAFAIGEAFRTGTHKAIIFAWLKSQGREEEKTAVYGLTRSWSQIGSAVSVAIAAAIVFVLQEYSVIFWVSAIPISLNILNFLGYPRSLDAVAVGKQPNFGQILWQGLRHSFSSPRMRRPLAESMGYEGMFKTAKDYLQPIIQQLVVASPLLLFLDPTQRTAVMLAVVYAAFYLLGSLSSRHSGAVARSLGSEQRAAQWLWGAFGLAFLVLLAGTLASSTLLAIISFLVLSVLQNVWRPILISRIANQAGDESLATVLSIESQAKSVGVAILAPLLGLAADATPPPYQFAPVACAGILIAITALVPRSEQAAPR